MNLKQAQADLALVEAHLAALGVVLSAALCVLGDHLKARDKAAKASRRAQRQARKGASGAR